MKHATLLATLTLSLAIATPLAAQSPPADPSGIPAPSNYGIDNPILQRAMNLARQTAERANGGLNQYRAQASMYGPASQSPFVDNGNDTWTFTFLGGSPGFTTPTLESVVTVSKDASKITIDYNGPIRNPSSVSSPSSSQPISPSLTLRRSMNLARQTAERANGGLSQYRAEAAMYGSTDKAPYVDNGNGSLTFSFKGGPPGSTIPTVESVITVSRVGETTVDYNGPIRQNLSSEQPQPQGQQQQ